MKKISLLILIVLFSVKGNAQFIVEDVNANITLELLFKQMVTVNKNLATLNGKASSGNATSLDNKSENIANKVLNKENLELAKDVEDAFWKVSDYLKTGKQINDIINKGGKIYQEVEEIDNLTFNPALQNNSDLNIANSLFEVLDATDELVDNAFDIITDDLIKADETGRVTMLKYIEEKIDFILTKLKLVKKAVNRKIREEEYYQEKQNIKHEIRND